MEPANGVGEVLKRVRKIELSTDMFVDSVFYGAYRSVFRGRGIEFSEVREYRPGDDVRTIDWNVTARMGSVFVKEFVEERDLNVMVVFDVSASIGFGTRRMLKRDVGIDISSSLMMSATRCNDRAGLLLFTSKVEKYVPPRKGRRHVLRMVSDLVSYKPAGGGEGLGNAMSYLGKVLKRRGVVFIISDFCDDPKTYQSQMKLLSKRHDVICVRITDAREKAMPDVGLIELEDLETGQQILVDTSDEAFRSAYSRAVSARDSGLFSMFRSSGIDLIEVTTEDDWVKPLMRFYRMRERRMIR